MKKEQLWVELDEFHAEWLERKEKVKALITEWRNSDISEWLAKQAEVIKAVSEYTGQSELTIMKWIRADRLDAFMDAIS